MTNRGQCGECGSVSHGPSGSTENCLSADSSKKPAFSRHRNGADLPLMLLLAFAIAMAGCGITSTKASASLTPIISVTISQAPPTPLLVGGTAIVSATVNNDIANAGVDWVAMCSSAPNCGTFSPSHTASGAMAVFTAPIAVPAHNTVAVTALSSTDHSKAFAASVTVISTVTGVTITQPPPGFAPAGVALTLAATVVAGDPSSSNEGVDWKATCDLPSGVVNCSPSGFHSAADATARFIVPVLSSFPDIVGSTITIAAFATADHNFSATASFIVTAPVTINLTQTPPSTLLANATANVAAAVLNDTTNSGVDWSVSCFNTPCGSVSPAHTASGGVAIFTAPPTVADPSHPVVTITATSAAAPSVTTSADVTIVASVSIQITQGVPSNLLAVNGTAPLVATVANDPANAGVDWTVTCGSPGTCGSFSPAHTASGAATMFTAPGVVPVGNTVTITATSTAAPTQIAMETDTIALTLPSNSLLSGRFVIMVSGKNSSNGPYAFGGTISGDGNGNITGGSLDLVDASGNAAPSFVINVISPSTAPSTYNIGPDGRGQIHLTINTIALNGSFGVNGTGKINLSVVFVTAQHALLSETDSFGGGTGTLDLQNANDLAAAIQNGTVLNATYSLKLLGVEVSSLHPGYFVAGAVTIHSTPASYAVSAYVADQSAGGAVTSVPAATVPQNGQATFYANDGELTLTSVNLGLPTHFNLDLWFIDANHFAVTDWNDALYSNGLNVIISGYMTAQPSPPAISGTFAFTEAGATTAAQPQAVGGIFTCGSTGALDVTPLAGTLTTSQAITAACAAPAAGRGLITLSGAGSTGISQFAAYPTVDQGIYLLELDGGSAGTSGSSGAGLARQQTVAAPISASALSGKYASSFSASTALGDENFAAQIVSDGISALSGVGDINSFNATAALPAGTPSSSAALSGSFTAGTDGRFPLALMITPATGQPAPEISTLHSACYIVDAKTCLLLGLDATAPGTGILQFQQTGF
jgi:hypothetical protein